MLYLFKEAPDYIDISNSKNVRIRNIVFFVVFALTVLICIFVSQFTINKEIIILECILGLILGFLARLFCAGILPNEKKQKNISIFRKFHSFSGVLCTGTLVNSGNSEIPYVNMVFWRTDNILHMCANDQPDDFGEITIPLDNIVFFVRDGDFYTKTEISRGGRIVGGLLAGTTGFLLGTNTNATTVEVDKRQTILYLECDGQEDTWVFDSEAYNTFMSLIPQFEYKKVISKPQISKTKSSNNLDDIKKLKELIDIGAITQSEYEAKKKQLLDL